MNCKISVIVPIYNVEKYLDRCVKSILTQTYTNIEVILVDDGSPDKCPQMCNWYVEQDGRVKVIHKKNGGLSDARNYGLDAATGEFVLFVDSDDYIEPDLCKRMVENISDDVDIISFKFRRFTDDVLKLKKEKKTIEKFCNADAFCSYINREAFTHMVCDKIFRRNLFDNVRFIKDRLAEDMAICYLLMSQARVAVSIDETFYNYYVRSTSIMGEGSLKLTLDAYKGECEAYDYCKNHYPQFMVQNNTRFLNQSMKTYLKLVKVYKKSEKDVDVKKVITNINNINKKGVSIKTKAFYYALNLSRSLAWFIFKILKLS